MPLDAATLSHRWMQSWPGLRPIGHELRFERERWVRFHALPESKRYPDSEHKYLEVLRRHNLLLSGLVSGTSANLLIMTVAWSDSGVATTREAVLTRAVPDAELWVSVLRDKAGKEEFWTHVYVTSLRWHDGALDPLLRLVADEETADVIIADDQLRWLVHPYDGGVDVLMHSPEDRDLIRDQHRDWLPSSASGT